MTFRMLLVWHALVDALSAHRHVQLPLDNSSLIDFRVLV
jgi:hypothetical protein